MKKLQIIFTAALSLALVITNLQIAAAKMPDPYITYQTGGHTCWRADYPTLVSKGDYNGRSGVKSTPSVESIGFFDSGWGDWAINRDGSQVNCLKINLFPSTTVTTLKDFKICGQAAEIKTSKSFWDSILGGLGSSRVKNVGQEVCTDLLSATNGTFVEMQTSNAGTIGALRFRMLPSSSFFGGTDNTDRVMRVSTQLENVNGTKGGVVSTAWSDRGFINANVNQAGGHLRGIWFALETPIGVNPPTGGTPAQCDDTIDNDGDGLIDYPEDPGCIDANDNDETDEGVVSNDPTCHDGLDNNGNGAIDLQDPICTEPGNLSEDTVETPSPSCSFTTNKTSIVKDVDNATLSWSCVDGPETATISNIGTVSPDGSKVVSPKQDTTYTIVYGSFVDTITIKVTTPTIKEQ